jgi:uncharacterized protein (DUF58 family)
MSKSRLRLKNRLAPALVLLLLALHLITPYRGFQVLLVGLGGACLLGYLWARSLARRLQLCREMRFGWAQAGDKMVERITLANEGWAPALWVEMADHSTLPDYPGSRGVSVTSRHSLRWHIEATCTRRGLFTLGPTTLHTGDPFGLFSVTLHDPATLPLMVLPPIVPLPVVQVAPGGRTGEGRPRADAIERTVGAGGVREYRPGDSLRWIHWPTSARQNTLFVRLFDSAPAGDWWVLLDMDRMVRVGEGTDSTEEHGVILAASLADRGLRAGRAVGLVAQGQQLAWLPPREGEGQRWELLRSLALASPGLRPLAEVLANGQATFGRPVSLIIITPSVDTAWVEALVPLLRRGAVPTVLLLEPRSFGGTGDAGMVEGLLTDLGVAQYRITRDLLDQPIAQMMQPTQEPDRVGRATSHRQPRETAWKVLA